MAHAGRIMMTWPHLLASWGCFALQELSTEQPLSLYEKLFVWPLQELLAERGGARGAREEAALEGERLQDIANGV